ncbi:MAG: peptide ABC transporter substrate-binding protein [Oligoflexia bacterium]|nr:peptide ABC transporter substrate-binding protein [Oligoflexia bacterium]
MFKKIILFFLFISIHSYAAKQEFNMRIETEPPTLDWNLATDYVSINVLYHLIEGLAEYNEKLEAVPSLASWKISPDGKTYTYTLKPNLKWSDGVPLTAQHFWDSWERALNPKTASGYAYFLFDIVGAKEYNDGSLKDAAKLGFKVKNESTFVVTLKKPASYFATIPAFTVTFPIRKDIIAKYGDKWTNPENMVVTGPFKLTKWQHDSKLELAPNPNYRGRKPKLEKVNIYIVTESTTAISMFETGKLNYLSRLPALEIERLKKNPGYRTLPYLRGYYYAFNVTKAPFNDVKVRKAFALSINREEITSLLKGGQIATSSWIPKGMLAYNPKIGLFYDPQKAKKLLAEAGFPEGKNFPSSTFMFDTRDDNKMIAEKLQSQWKNILGINLHAQNEEWKVYLGRLRADSPVIFRHGWGADFPDPDNFMNMFTSYSGNNYTKWKNKKYDQIIEQAAAERSSKKRIKLYDQAQKLLTEEEIVIVPLFIEAINYLISSNVKGLQIDSLGLLKIHKVEMQ